MQKAALMDQRLKPVPVVEWFAGAVRQVAGVIGFYAGGSLASSDFQPAVSDVDLVAVIESELNDRQRKDLQRLHETTRKDDPSAAKLHCVYVPHDQASDVSAPHLTWAHCELYRRPLSGIARAELLRGGITVLGPPPADLLPPMDRAALQAAARGELTGYWRGAVRKPWLWLDDVYVDLGLLTLARVEATLKEDRLITKREALTRLDRFDVPPELVREIARRRQGEHITLTRWQRVRRASRARRLCALGIRAMAQTRS